MQWYLKVLKNYATFSGRARRKEYWMFNLINYLIYMFFIVIALSNAHNSNFSNLFDASVLFPLAFLVIYSLAVLLPSLAVTVRRLHDINKSGWWLLIVIIPSVLVEFAQDLLIKSSALSGAAILLVLGASAYFIFLMAKEGTIGENRFGPDSIERSDTDTKDSV